jgi:hypothetical protein
MNPIQQEKLFSDISTLIADSKQRVALAVNAEITWLYWSVGQRIKTEIMGDSRAAYGKQTIARLSEQLTAHFGSGWSEKQLRHCLRFAEIFPDEAIVSALRRQLSWTELPDKKLLQQKLHQAVEYARNRLMTPHLTSNDPFSDPS